MHTVGLLAYGEAGLTPPTNGGRPLLRNVCFFGVILQACPGTTTVNQYIGEVGTKIETLSLSSYGPMLLEGGQQQIQSGMPRYDPFASPQLSFGCSLPCRAMQSTTCLVASLAPARRGVGRVTQSPLDDNACIGQVHVATFPHGPSFQPRLHIESPKRHGCTIGTRKR